MRIGIDLDGVIFDSEKEFRVYQELYDMQELKRNSKVNEREVRHQKRYDWSEQEFMNFLNKYYEPVVQEANYMPGAMLVLKMLKEEGHELIIITARGGMKESIINLTEERLEKDNMKIFNECYYQAKDKAEVCKKANINLMIDDSNENCKKTSEQKIKTIYLKDAPSYDMEENQYLKVLYNWGEIYRYIKSMEKIG